jgi:branched-subunit amino acid aminotransferase/4-amino-4-deoxychorismate lyase
MDTRGARTQSLCSSNTQYSSNFPISSSKTHNIKIIVGNQKAIGVGPPNEALLFVILCPVGPYYPNGFKPVSLYGTTEYVRAAPGGASVAPRLPGY